ncbi:hypothetical protein HCN44_000816 [Aphidius gifuensis]|uniref:Uncharacterized protein n=1 Tax=Aphidius gifuensis TaxID=684658 RepID=A0A834XRQ8_APHGI|nr:hypothetical protein HCN44_000816 [Aphidius gifuensis]
MPETKNDVARSFIVANELQNFRKKYIDLGPPNLTTTSNIFLNYQKGKCTSQPICVNKIGSVPAVVAEYLNIPNVKKYTSHLFRRSSATLLADTVADITIIMRSGGSIPGPRPGPRSRRIPRRR